MKKLFQIIVILVVIAYVASPIDFHIGPLDDIIVALLGFATQAMINRPRVTEKGGF